MKTQSLLLKGLALLCAFSFSVAKAQVQTARYVSMHPSTNAYYEYLPQGYNANGSETYPVIIFVHGVGELGAGSTSSLPALLNAGIPRVINSGKFPTSFTVNGVTSKFIVISPQFIYWPGPGDVNGVLDYVVSKYKVDLTRVYVTGLSMGGGVTWDYVANALHIVRVAAIAPVCGASPPSRDRARFYASYNLPVWAFHNQNDPTVSVQNTIQYVDYMNEAPTPNPPAKKTIFPVSGHDAWTKAYDPTYKENNMNVYEWMLQYKKTNGTANQPPVVNAGADKTITLPTNSVSLAGSATDANGSVASYSWTKTSGPTQFTLSNSTAASTNVTNLAAGTYVFRLTATDNQGATAYDEVTVVVNSASNAVPVVNAGADKAITLPTNSVSLAGSATDANGSVTGYAWSRVSGPTQFTFSSASAASTNVTNLAAGTYVFRLTATDNQGATAYDDVTVVVNAAANVAPVSNAGADKTLTLPANSVSLAGTGSDADGSIRSYSWTRVDGPTQFTFSNAAAATTTVSNLVAGTYTFRLTVTDNAGATAADDVVVRVLSSTPLGNAYPVPGRIEGENYAAMLGIQTEATQDAGGGRNVSWVNPGDWMDYNVNVQTTGSYRVSFRVSAPANTQLQLRKADGTVLSTVSLEATWGYQLWRTVTASVSLTAGTQTLRVYANQGAWNLNWFEFALASAGSGTGGGSAAPPTSAADRFVKVKLYGGTNPYNNSEWNNWNVSTASGNLKYSDGTTSTINASLSNAGTIVDNGNPYVAGIAPSEVLRHSTYATTSRTLTLSGLTPNATYDIELYASRISNPGNSTSFASGGTSQTVNTYNNSTQKASFAGRTADGSGKLTITVTQLNTYNYLNGFMLTQKGTGASTARSTNAETAPSVIATTAVADTAVAQKAAIQNREAFGVYPNPFVDQLFLQLNNKEIGSMSVSVIDQSGRTVQQFQFNKAQELFNETINIRNLNPGLYIVKIQIGKWTESRKVMRN